MSLQILLIIHVAISCFLIAIILLQQGKGADVGATFGGGGNTLFGAAGADNLLTKVTAFTAFGFMLTSIMLAVMQRPSVAARGALFDNLPEDAIVVPEESLPAVPSSTEDVSNEGSDKSAAATSGTATTDGKNEMSAKTAAKDSATNTATAPVEAVSDTVNGAGSAVSATAAKVVDSATGTGKKALSAVTAETKTAPLTNTAVKVGDTKIIKLEGNKQVVTEPKPE